MSIDMSKHIWEGWRVSDFVSELLPLADMIMNGQSWNKPFRNRKELKQWCMENQPYYKKYIPEVVGFFANRYGL